MRGSVIDDEGLVERVVELAHRSSLIFDKASKYQWVKEAYDCLVDITDSPGALLSDCRGLTDRLEISHPMFLRVLTFFQEALLVSPSSPYSLIYQRIAKPENRLTAIKNALKILRKDISSLGGRNGAASTPQQIPHPKKGRPLKILRSQTSQLSVSGLSDDLGGVGKHLSMTLLCESDETLVEAKQRVEEMLLLKKSKVKSGKAIALGAAKWRDQITSRAEKEEKALLRQQTQVGKLISTTFQQFWKLASTIALRRYRAVLHKSLAADRLTKQMDFVRRAERYASKLSNRLIENRKLMPNYLQEDSGGSPASYSPRGIQQKRERRRRAKASVTVEHGQEDDDEEYDEGYMWSEQEGEDAEFEAEMEAETAKDEEDDDELARLKEESTMDIEELLRRIKQNANEGLEPDENVTTNLRKRVEPPCGSSDPEPARKKGRVSRRRARQKAFRSGNIPGGVEDTDAEVKEDVNDKEGSLVSNKPLRVKEERRKIPPTRPRRVSSFGIDSFVEVEKVVQGISNSREEEEISSKRKKRRRVKTNDESSQEHSTKEAKWSRSADQPRGRKEDEPMKSEGESMDDVDSDANIISPLLRADLRPYQVSGFRWLLNLHDCDINGILADEMGLGKTLQSISVLSYLASERGIWGPHLIIVPTSVLLNWEGEFRKFLPGFKVLVYMGTKKDRERKRVGWQTPFAFNCCITSYTIALQDAPLLKRLSWYYIILDEAHNLKNSSSQKWQSLLSFNSERRLLLTGTPLQNNLMELWSLLYFLMPNVFGTHQEWDVLFNDPIVGAIDKGQLSGKGALPENIRVIKGLYRIIKPFILRRLKKDVENQMPSKIEHVIKCRLTNRQKYIYDEFISLSDEKLSGGGSYLTVMNILMQLRKVCNHPDLVEDTQVLAPVCDSRLIVKAKYPHWLHLWPQYRLNRSVDQLSSSLSVEGMVIFNLCNATLWSESSQCVRAAELIVDSEISQQSLTSVCVPGRIEQQTGSLWSSLDRDTREDSYQAARRRLRGKWHKEDVFNALLVSDPWVCRQRKYEQAEAESRYGSHRTSGGAQLCCLHRQMWQKCSQSQWVTPRLLEYVQSQLRESRRHESSHDLEAISTRRLNASHYLHESSPGFDTKNPNRYNYTDLYQTTHWTSIIKNYVPDHSDRVFPNIRRAASKFQMRRIHRVLPLGPETELTGVGGYSLLRAQLGHWEATRRHLVFESISDEEWDWKCRSEVILPPASMIEQDSGKLLALTPLLMRARAEGLKVIIFTQMSRMLDILEKYLAYYGLIYVRLSGSTKPEIRQQLVDRFNNDPRILAFIASTRAGGVGINLTSASVVIFYDTDWNPAMDRQAMDRCHRLGQTRDVHIYRFINEATIEENIWRKQLQKRLLDDIIVDRSRGEARLLKTEDDVRNLLFTVDSTDDLYATRILHDRTAAGDLMLRNMEEADATIGAELRDMEVEFDEVLAQVEDAEDVVAAKTTKNELVRDLEMFKEEFGPSVGTATTPLRKASAEDSTTTPDMDELKRGEVRMHIDDTAGDIWVTPDVARAVKFLEECCRTKHMEIELRGLTKLRSN